MPKNSCVNKDTSEPGVAPRRPRPPRRLRRTFARRVRHAAAVVGRAPGRDAAAGVERRKGAPGGSELLNPTEVCHETWVEGGGGGGVERWKHRS